MQGSESYYGGSVSCNDYHTFWASWIGGIFMTGYGTQVGQNVKIVYNDNPSPTPVTRMFVSSSAYSSWLLPGYLPPQSTGETLLWILIESIHSYLCYETVQYSTYTKSHNSIGRLHQTIVRLIESIGLNFANCFNWLPHNESIGA